MSSKPYIFLFLFSQMLFFSCRGESSHDTNFYFEPQSYTQQQWLLLESIEQTNVLTQKEKASQVLMTGIDGDTKFPLHLYRHFDGILPGAILLFSYNIAATPKKVHDYIASCHVAFSEIGRIPVLFSIDHEGGVVNRLSGVTSPLPSARTIAQSLTPLQAKELYYYTGLQLMQIGIPMNLGLVAETLTDTNTTFLSTRSYGSSVDEVTSFVLAAFGGYRNSGVIPVLKHFPGNSSTDPHTGATVLDVDRETLEFIYCHPFFTIMESNAPVILISHAVVDAIDPDRPFCLSPLGVQGFLRDDHGFTGLALTDDISMTALAGKGISSADNAVQALRSGCDMILTSDTDISKIVSSIIDESHKDHVFARRLDEAVANILRVKLESGLLPTRLEAYARSRRGLSASSAYRTFNDDAFFAAKKRASDILEEADGKP